MIFFFGRSSKSDLVYPFFLFLLKTEDEKSTRRNSKKNIHFIGVFKQSACSVFINIPARFAQLLKYVSVNRNGPRWTEKCSLSRTID